MSSATTYLDFGMTKAGKRTCYDYREGQGAYDLFMGARYLNDLIAYREGDVSRVYHPEDVRDQLRKYSALLACADRDGPLTYYEIGSSVMGAIDGIEYLNRTYQELDTRRVAWHGVDNSPFMNAMARYTHEGYDLHLSAEVRPVPCDLFFAKGVSLLYAIHDEATFAAVLDASRIAIFDYTFAVDGASREVVGTGLPVTYLNLDAWQARLRATGRTITLNPYTLRVYHADPGKVTYDCIYGEPPVVERYLKTFEEKAEAFERVWTRPLVRPAR